MRIVQLSPGAGGMYCGNCLRDNSLVAALRAQGHDVLMVPLYLPLTLDETDQSASMPIFFGGISVYLEQVLPAFARSPHWLRRLLATRPLLKWAGKRAGNTRPSGLGELTLSMMRGESGRQARELAELIAWLKQQPRPDLVSLSNALLLGMTPELKRELRVPVVCSFQGEHAFLDKLPEPYRTSGWKMLAERAADIDKFIAPTRYFADFMMERLHLPADKVAVVHNGIATDGYDGSATVPPANGAPVVGFFARMCREKGLDTLVEAWIRLRRRGKAPPAKLRMGGWCGSADEPFVRSLRERLAREGLLDQAEFHPNVSRAEKQALLRSLSVFSVPARYGEAFGLYLIEAMAAGVPVVQPRTASFPELIAATGGGRLCPPDDPDALAAELEALLLDRPEARRLGEQGRRAVFERFTDRAMANGIAEVYRGVSV